MDRKALQRYIDELTELIYLNKLGFDESNLKPRAISEEEFMNGDVYINFWTYNNLYACHKLEDMSFKTFYREIYKAILPTQYDAFNEWYKRTNRDYNLNELFED